MKTGKLYSDNVYLKETSANVVEVCDYNGKNAIVTDNTIFFPEGGGQSSDRGLISLKSDGDDINYIISAVYEKDGIIYHIIDDASIAGRTLPVAGDECVLNIDWEHRFENMQRHSGEHILSGIFYREFGGINRGFHMGDDYMTIDIALEDEAKVQELTFEDCKLAELQANYVVYDNLPITVRHFDSREEAGKQPMRKKLSIEEDITLVGIGSDENDWGCVACCGTHPSATGQVGLIKIYKIENNKGMYRIYFEAGSRAFKRYQDDFETLTELGHRLSAGAGDLIAKYDSQTEKNREKGYQLAMLKKEVIAREAKSIIESLPESGFFKRRYSILSLDDLSQLSREISPSIPQGKLTFFIHEPSTTVLLTSSGSVDCGKLVRENVSIYNGKGGGNSTLARAIFAKEEYIDTFIDLLEKHLR